MIKSKSVVLVGFMGTGKSSVGKILAKHMRRQLVDVDQYIEKKEKRKISDIFEKEGEAEFRRLEKEAIREISEIDGAVITTGGGAVLDPENLEALKKTGCLVALFASPETIFDRVKNSRHRPLLKAKDVYGEIKRLLEIRKPYYEKADVCCQTDGRTPSEVAKVILEKLETEVF